MRKHREIIAPQFEEVTSILTARLGPYDAASWTSPNGGYFISLDVAGRYGPRVVELAKQAGIAMTGAGAAFRTEGSAGSQHPNRADISLTGRRGAPPSTALTTCVLLAPSSSAVNCRPLAHRAHSLGYSVGNERTSAPGALCPLQPAHRERTCVRPHRVELWIAPDRVLVETRSPAARESRAR
jgi:hypothetical protein